MAVPELLNENPFDLVGMNEQPLEIEPELTEHRTMLESPGLESATWLSVDASPDPVTETVTPLGPE